MQLIDPRLTRTLCVDPRGNEMDSWQHLQDLVDRKEYGALVEEVGLAHIAATWMAYHRAEDHTGPAYEDPNWWAVELWMDAAWFRHEAWVRACILEIIAIAESGDDFGIIGAAIMEVFITKDLDRVAWIEREAATSEGFRRSLANVWIWGSVPDAVSERVERAAGVALAKPRGYSPGPGAHERHMIERRPGIAKFLLSAFPPSARRAYRADRDRKNAEEHRDEG
jgi:hypothetical protein